MSTQPDPGADGAGAKCVEHGVWMPLPQKPPASPDAFTLKLRDVDPQEHDRIAQAGRMTFHAVGCTGAFDDHRPQVAVARAMVAQLDDPGASGLPGTLAAPSSFLFHLGDVVYKSGATSDAGVDTNNAGADEPAATVDQATMYNDQFYAPYTAYHRRIFAIAGNHDGKHSPHRHKSAIDHFLANFCAASMAPSPDNTTDQRPAMPQPYVYWRLSTPLAQIIGLYANIANGGLLDDPANPDSTPQYHWLVAQLRHARQKNLGATPRKAIVLAVHYPPYSGTANFTQRGDPTLGPTNATHARPLALWLRQAFAESGQRPDVVLSAHAHLYQRVTYRYGDRCEVPYLIAGSGGHGPIEKLGLQCDGRTVVPPKPVPFDCILPPGLAIPDGERAQVVAYDDQSFGFLRLTIASGTLAGEFFAVDAAGRPSLGDSFTLDLATHRLRETAGD
jgi:hypothetical protein